MFCLHHAYWRVELPGIIILPALLRNKKMKRSLVLAATAVAAIGGVGCSTARNVFHRGAPCGATPQVGEVTTYSSGCGMPECPTCGTTSGTPVMVGESYLGGFLGDQAPMPMPAE
jgi:hypothetical protein